ncbi:MAG: SET domain-containing protein-lysine N-methyltransferase [Acidobacteria bacterium]|nr:SET domain-containing protein-lysine N-methyltransferase [Acidobacteriota bacterium]
MPRQFRLTRFVREVLIPGDPNRQPRVSGRHARFKLLPVRSSIHGWGLVAGEDIPARRRVIEYTGQVISNEGARRRIWRPVLHLFHLDEHRQLDGGIGGSGAELVNHSCEPSLYARVIRRRRIYFISLRRIRAGKELSIDYRLRPDSWPVPCHCGAPSCRGVMNLP